MGERAEPTIELTCDDKRGKIYAISYGDGKKINMLFTKKGYARSGDVHGQKQYDLELQGKWSIWYREGEEDTVRTLAKNDQLVIPPNIPHLFICEEDSVLLEWWEGDFQCDYYPRYRKIVETLFENPRELDVIAELKKIDAEEK